MQSSLESIAFAYVGFQKSSAHLPVVIPVTTTFLACATFSNEVGETNRIGFGCACTNSCCQAVG